MAQKRIIIGQPDYTDRSQYNFTDDYSGNFDYNDSNGLPPNSDKFSRKDIHTTPYSDDLNEAIIERNLKFDGGNFIRIDKLRIVNAGVSHDIKNVEVRGYLFSHHSFAAYTSTYGTSLKSYSSLKSGIMSGGKRFFRWNNNHLSEGNDIGNLEFAEGNNVISNINLQLDASDNVIPPQNGAFNFYDDSFDPSTALTTNESDKLDLQTQIFDENFSNPIYFAFWMKGDADRWFGTDEREERIQVFRIDNLLDIFLDDGQGNKSPQIISIDEMTTDWKVKDFSITISTLPGGQNSFGDENDYERFFELVQPPLKYEPNESSPNTFLNIGPNRQLFNYVNAGNNYTSVFRDYFPKSTIGALDNNTGEMSNNFVDLQSYYDSNTLESLQASAPTTITFDFQMVRPTTLSMTAIEPGIYFYFVIHWNDIKNEFADLQDFLDKRPINEVDLINLQEQDLYIVRRQEQSQDGTSDYDSPPLKHTYNSPGIKNLKVVTFSYDEDEGVGRWKLVKCRFFLDIPLNQYPDFGALGGSDYTTIPWPFTTPIIGGVDSNSKYKKSVEQTLSGGNIGDVDIIDERFLIEDSENDVMGKSINLMDLEQVRYFNKPYGINELLEIPFTTYAQDLTDEFLGTLPFPEFQEEFDISSEFDDMLGEVNVSDYMSWAVAGRPDINAYILPLIQNGTIDSIPRAADTGDIPRPVEDFYNPTYGNPYYDNLYNDFNFWNASTPNRTFSMESSVGQIFINDNLDSNLIDSCQVELNTGNLSGKSIYDSVGKNNDGFLMGDYRVKKIRKGESMRRDTFIKVPKKVNNRNGAL